MKYWIISLVAILLATNAFWLYIFIDEAVTDMYTEANNDRTDQKYRQSLALSNLNLIGLSIDEAKDKVGKDIHGFEPFEKEGCLNVGQICLQISDNRTIEVIR